MTFLHLWQQLQKSASLRKTGLEVSEWELWRMDILCDTKLSPSRHQRFYHLLWCKTHKKLHDYSQLKWKLWFNPENGNNKNLLLEVGSLKMFFFLNWRKLEAFEISPEAHEKVRWVPNAGVSRQKWETKQIWLLIKCYLSVKWWLRMYEKICSTFHSVDETLRLLCCAEEKGVL